MSDSSGLRAGAAQVDITPGPGVQLAGAVGAYRPAKLVGDPLFARALVLESGGRRLCILSLDLCIVTREYTDPIRQGAASRWGFDPDAVLVHAIQTHSAPGLGHFMVDADFANIPPEYAWIRGGDDAYSAGVVERSLEAIGSAVDALQPADVGAGSGIEGRMAFNRRAVMRDGTVGMPGRTWPGPLGPTGIRYIEGPIDPELGVVCFRGASLRPVSLLLSYTCHPVHVFPKRIVSADWPGALVDALRAAHGPECVPLVLNGPCGNINPWPPFDPDYVEDHRRMGGVLAEMAGKVLEQMEFRSGAVLDWRSRHLKIAFRGIPSEELDEARRILREHPEPVFTDDTRTQVAWDWMRAASIYSVYLQQQREGVFDYEMQVLRIGDVALVGLPGEPFVEGGLRIKLASPTYPTYVVHMVTQYVGYVPIREGIARGGHEASTRYWAKLAPDALDRIVDAAGEMLREVW